MPHEYFDFESHSTEGLMLSAAMLNKYREDEEIAMEKMKNKSPKLQKGGNRARKLKGERPDRMKNLQNKHK